VTTIVVGGGIIGACTLYELARAGEPALLLERSSFGGEGTGKSAAIVRMHYSNPEVVRMALRSREAFLGQPFYERSGWLFLVDQADADLARANRELQLAEGSASEEVDPVDHGLSSDGVAYALLERDSGYADPVAATVHYVETARRAGAEAREGVRVEAVEPGRGVLADGEWIEAETVVLAAGAWTKKLAAGFGLELPLEHPREQDVLFATGGAPPILRSVSSQADRIYFRPYGDGLLVGRGYPKQYELVDPDGFTDTVDAAFVADVEERLRRRLPQLRTLRQTGGRVGLYEVTPDWHPLLGRVKGYDGIVLATGGSGHCFKLGPAIGELVAGAVLGHEVGDTFALSRFAEGRELRSTYGGNRA
jgi:sarcosine oxidase subunit beta